MESKHKNALIVALLAVVLVMAVGYAAYAQQLTINSNATIQENTGDKKNWDIRFDESKTDAVASQPGATGSQPVGTINSISGNTASISAKLSAPGDEITYTFTVVNYGTIKASLATPKIILTSGTDEDGNNSDNTVKLNNIIFTVNNPVKPTLDGNVDDSTTFTVTAEFDSNASNVSADADTANIKITLDANQAA